MCACAGWMPRKRAVRGGGSMPTPADLGPSLRVLPQAAAAALLAGRLVQAPGGPRVKLDWVLEARGGAFQEGPLMGCQDGSALSSIEHALDKHCSRWHSLRSCRLCQLPGGSWVEGGPAAHSLCCPGRTRTAPAPPISCSQEKEGLAARVLLGVQQLAARGRLTRLAAQAICGFVARALEEAHAAAHPADASCECGWGCRHVRGRVVWRMQSSVAAPARPRYRSRFPPMHPPIPLPLQPWPCACGAWAACRWWC